MNNEIAVSTSFDVLAKQAEFIAKSDILPEVYRGNPANCFVAMEIASRMNTSAMAVMQNLDIIQGRPSWSAKYIIASINTTGKFSPLRYEMVQDEKEIEFEYQITEWVGKERKITQKKAKILNVTCRAYATELRTGEVIYGHPYSLKSAYIDGLFDKKGSKWQTQPELMLTYRAASIFGRIYAPELLVGLPVTEEVSYEPIEKEIPVEKTKSDVVNAILDSSISDLAQFESELNRVTSKEDAEYVKSKYKGKFEGEEAKKAKAIYENIINNFN